MARRIATEKEAAEEGFLAELDYTAEAYNAQRFNIEMRNRGLQDVVTVPTVVEELSTTRILTTEWVSGVGLDQSKEGGVPNLCTVALNAYLVMLLETGCLHCGELYLVCYSCFYFLPIIFQLNTSFSSFLHLFYYCRPTSRYVCTKVFNSFGGGL